MDPRLLCSIISFTTFILLHYNILGLTPFIPLISNIHDAHATPNPCQPHYICEKEHRDMATHLNSTKAALQKGDTRNATESLDQAQTILKEHSERSTGNTSNTTTGTLNVIKNVSCIPPIPACPSASQFTMSVNGQNPNPGSFPGSSEGTRVTLSPGQYSITETVPNTGQIGVNKTMSPDCSGSINVLETKTCTITNQVVYS
jgi:hypothetical protein